MVGRKQDRDRGNGKERKKRPGACESQGFLLRMNQSGSVHVLKDSPAPGQPSPPLHPGPVQLQLIPPSPRTEDHCHMLGQWAKCPEMGCTHQGSQHDHAHQVFPVELNTAKNACSTQGIVEHKSNRKATKISRLCGILTMCGLYVCNREEQIGLHIGSVSFTLTFVIYCFCYKLRMLRLA